MYETTKFDCIDAQPESIQLLSEFEEMRNIEKISGEVILDDSNEFSNLETLQMMK